MSTINLDKLLSGDKKVEVLKTLSGEGKDVSLGDFLAALEAKQATLYIDALKSLTMTEILAFASAAPVKATRTPGVEVPTMENFKEPAVQAAWKGEVVALLEATQMGDARGLTPAKIRESVGRGSETQARVLLKELETEGKIAFAGGTKGKKYVVAALAAQAKAVHEAEVEAAKKLKEEKAAAKAKADAEAAKAPATAPVVEGKAKPTAKTK